MNEIKITIVGQTKVGKSTITKIIYDALKQHGIKTELSNEVLFDYGGDERIFNERLSMFSDKRIGAVKNKSKIVLHEIQANMDIKK